MGKPNQTVYFDDLVEGDTAPEFRIDKVIRSHIVRYAGASGDFNPIHHDEPLAQGLGNPGVFAMGMMSAGFLAHMLTDWLGVGNLRRFNVRFASRVWPGDSLTCSGRVVAKRKEGDDGLLDCELHVLNQDGERVIIGKASAVLPIRNAQSTDS